MSTDALKQAEQTQIKNIEEKTGKKISEWVDIVNKSGFQKHSEMVNLLKDQYGFTYGNANMVVHWARQSHAGAAENETDWLAEQYKGKENLKAWYDKLVTEIKKFGSDIELSPKKTYISLRRKKQFAIIQPSTKTRIDIGLHIRNIDSAGKLEASGSWNTMCTHRIKIEDEKDMNKDVMNWLKQAYEQAG